MPYSTHAVEIGVGLVVVELVVDATSLEEVGASELAGANVDNVSELEELEGIEEISGTKEDEIVVEEAMLKLDGFPLHFPN